MILIKATLGCNFVSDYGGCEYCYQHPVRKEHYRVNLEAIEETVRRLYSQRKRQIILHGGEPLSLPKHQVEFFLKLAYDLTGGSSIQTNGSLIDEEIIQLFKRYKTRVGVSIDGPWPCNELRVGGSKEIRKKITNLVLDNIKILQDEGIPVSIIVVVHQANALGDRRELLKLWVKDLSERKISGRLNPCYTRNSRIDLTPIQLRDFYLDMLDFMVEEEIRFWSPYSDIINSLTGRGNVVCVFRECDPFCTPSATTVFGDGSVGVCVRLYGLDGKIYLRSPERSTFRSEILRQTDCKNCPWWEHCYGGCPGMSINGDWRNKDQWCLAYKALFEKIQKWLDFLGFQDLERKKSSILKEDYRHLDNGVLHLDSDLKSRSKSHCDGIEHLDGNFRHLDSDWRCSQ